MGNIHPRFWMWYMGASNFTGALGDFLAAILGSNLGDGDHAAAEIDKQVVSWLKEMLGYPATASGTFVSGGSMANLIGLTVARNRMSGIDMRELGVGALKAPMRFYGSDQIHSCHQIAVEAMGLGNQALRRVPSDRACRMDISALRAAIAEDRAAGAPPASVMATAGTVNTGAIDNLDAIADICAEEGLWLPAERVIRSLDRIIEWRGRPGTIRVDNGPEYISETLRKWAEKHGVTTIQHIQPGQPQQNAYVERYNRTVRHEWLDQYIIESIEEAQDQATQWLWTCNNDRPNMGIGGITPAMKLKMAA